MVRSTVPKNMKVVCDDEKKICYLRPKTVRKTTTKRRATTRTRKVAAKVAGKTTTRKRTYKLKALKSVSRTRTTRRMTRGRKGTTKPRFTTEWQIEHQSMGIGPLKKGELGKFGYTSKRTLPERKQALNQAVKEYGALSVFRKLNAVATYNKNTHPDAAKIFLHDRDMVRDVYM